MFNEKLEKMKIYKNYREESAMRISYWLFGEEAVRYMEDYSEEKTAKENLKASAKAKLIAGEALTEDEANTIVI